MRFCQTHWDRLRDALEERGLAELIAKDGERAAANLVNEAETGEATLANYDPLMRAHWAIVGNATRMLGERAGPSTVAYLMLADDVPEDVCELPGANGRTWPRCPVCYLGLGHELTCRGGKCKLPKVDGFAWMIDRAADDQVELWEKLKAAEQGVS